MNIGTYSIDEYNQIIRTFHGNAAPGVLIGGVMVDAAMKRIDTGQLHDALCETHSCLPDAIQLLTPCTIGNGWLRIVDLGRFALTLYEKQSGNGVRVFLDPGKMDRWPEIKGWFLKLKPKKQQDRQALDDQILRAGSDICGFQEVQVKPLFLTKWSKGAIGLCPACGEAYPVNHGSVCRGCQDPSPYGHVESGIGL